MRKGTAVRAARDLNQKELYSGSPDIVCVPKDTLGKVVARDSETRLIDVTFDNGHSVWVKEACIKKA